MNPYKYLPCALLLSVTTLSLQAAPIYKVVDEQTGHVTYTDQPSNYLLNAQKTIYVVDVPSQTMPTMPPPSAPAVNRPINGAPLIVKPVAAAPVLNDAASTQSVAGGAMTTNSASDLTSQLKSGVPANMATLPAAARGDYQLIMTTPQTEQAYLRPAQHIDVQLAVTPQLGALDTIKIYIDGEQVAQGDSASIATIDLLPGEHILSAKVINKNGDSIAEVEQRVYILLNTNILQQKKQLVQQLKAYQALPWQQKALLKLRQKNRQDAKAADNQQTSSAFD